MCGIAGIYHYRDRTDADAGVLRAMTDVITHRGPDEDGFHVDGPVGLGMRRLSIIDLTTGTQPHYNEDRTVAVVCNGEIYNYRELRSELLGRGHNLTTQSDVEVIPHLYEELGVGLLERLRGMFAIALWDARRGRLFLARDRVGIKPLYHADVAGTILFGSEIKALLRHPALSREVDAEALHHYLSLNYVPAPFTLIDGVRQLLPGEYLVCDAAGATRRSYWDLHFSAADSLGEEEWTRKVRDALQDAVASHLVSDVPFGAFLSGGIDSSAVVALMSSVLEEPVSTFSIDFEEKSFSEAAYARMIAERYRTDHHTITASARIVDLLESLIWHADDPLADSSMIPVYLIARFARERVTMVLTGDGGDEVFAGYPTYNAYYVRERYRRIPALIRRQLIRRAVQALPVSHTKVSFDFKAKRFVEGAELDAENAHFWWRIILAEDAKNALYSDAFRERLAGFAPRATHEVYRDYFDRSGTDDPLSRMLYVDTRFYLPADMLVKVDRMTMANALEARVPFLDHELVELAATIPSGIKFKNRRQKYLLKKTLEPLLPAEILYRKKAGFNVPVNAWLAGDMAGFARGLLAPDRVGAAGFFRPEAVTRLLDDHAARKEDHSFAIWSLLCFQIWYERFIAADAVAPPNEVARRWGLRLGTGTG
jgi:asparagine synthase (glutamine-hydrolysing)